MDRQLVARGVAALERIASALERVGSSLETLAGTALSAVDLTTAGAAPAGVRRRTVASTPRERRRSPLCLLPVWFGGHLDHLAAEAAVRRSRPWLGMVGVALAGTAVLAVGDWWLLVPLAACAWWWCPREWPATWLVPLMCAVVGAAWVSVGIALLNALPVPVAGAVWAALAAGLAAVGAWFRIVGDDPEGAR